MPRCFLGRPLTPSPRASRANSGLSPRAGRGKKETAPLRLATADMTALLLRRLGTALPTLLLVSMLVFGLQKLLPGDPALALAGEERNPEVVEYLRQKYRFNDPVPVQYAVWLNALAHGDFGTSVRTRLPIGTML